MPSYDLDSIYHDSKNYGYLTTKGKRLIKHPVGRDFKITKIETCLETGIQYLTFETKYGGKTVHHTLSRKQLNYEGMNELASKGFDIKDLNLFLLLISDKEDEYFATQTVEFTHTGVGWIKIPDEYKKDISSPDGYAYRHHNKVGTTNSKYTGDLNIEPKGTLKKQCAFIKKYIQGYTPTEIAVAIGLSAVVNGRLRSIVHNLNIIAHFVGDSSTGKTTAAMLAVSVAGKPSLQETSLMTAWSSTANALIARIRKNKGMPTALDELSKYLNGSLTTAVYSLSDGRDKDRLNKDASLKTTSNTDGFETTIISTGEATISGKCSNNTGIKARLIEIDTKFTPDAKTADIIKKRLSGELWSFSSGSCFLYARKRNRLCSISI